MNFSSHILTWFRQNKRDLPWRITKDPYKIWVSEIMLQQTQVSRGINYYLRFIERFPNIESLASSTEQEVLLFWQGLGYYSRARNMHKTAQEVVQKYDGRFPDDEKQISSLKGIGAYTAAAILSIAYNKPIPAIDGNVFRVLSRVLGIETPVNTTKGAKEFKEISGKYIVLNNPGEYNQAMMEFGAIVCKPKDPNCKECQLIEYCYAFKHNKITSLPVKITNKKIRSRYFYYLHIYSNNQIIIYKRTKKDIWQQMFEYPLIEMEEKHELPDILKGNKWKAIFLSSPVHVEHISEVFIHQLTHQKINAWFIRINTPNLRHITFPESEIISIEDFKNLPKHRLIEKYLSTLA